MQSPLHLPKAPPYLLTGDFDADTLILDTLFLELPSKLIYSAN